MIIDLNGKNAVVTGGSRGIGEVIKNVLEECGAVVHDFSRSNFVDILSYHSIKRNLDKLNRVDILVNNAGIFTMNNVDNFYGNLVKTNIEGTMNCLQQIVPIMKTNNFGKIVNIASIDGIRGFSKHSEYAATKGAIISMTASLAKELARNNINVNCVSPGYVRTDMTEKYHSNAKMHNDMMMSSPFRRLTEKRDIANMVAFLCSDLAKNITGQNIIVDAGVTC